MLVLKYDLFKMWMLEEVKKHLTENEYTYYEEEKEDQQEERLVIEEKDCQLKFRVAVQSMYQAYNSGRSMEEIAEGLVKEKERNKVMKLYVGSGMLGKYVFVERDLYVYAVGGTQKKRVLAWGIYKQIGDVVLGVHLRLNKNENSLCEAVIDREFLNKWEMPEEAVLKKALDNTMRMAPPRFYSGMYLILAALTGKCDGIPIEKYRPTDIERRDGCFFSTDKKTNGATAIFYPGVAAQICKVFETSTIYIVPTSIHEVVIHDCRCVEELRTISKVFEKVIKESTPEDEILCHHILRYQVETDRFTMVI